MPDCAAWLQTEDGRSNSATSSWLVDGEKVDNNDDIYKVMDKHHMGDTVNVEVIRRGRRMTVPVRLTELPQHAPSRHGE